MKRIVLIVFIFTLLSTAMIFLYAQSVDTIITGKGSAKIGDIDMAYITYGRGEPLIMIMGYSGTMDMWDTKLIRILSLKYKVIVFDNRGIGRTGAGSCEFTIEQFAQDTAGLMDALKIKKAHVLGWSLGTYIAQELALNYPKKIRKLVLYGADVGGKQAIDPDERTMALMRDTSGDGGGNVTALLRTLFPDKWLKGNPDPRKYFPKITESSSPENIKRQFNAWRKWKGTYDRLPKLKMPTLLITGTEDINTPWQNSIMMAKLIRGAWLVQIDGAGHGLMYQYPERTGKAIITFLED